MKIIIYQNREVYKEESKIGNDSENKIETLEFEFPEEYKDFTKYIEFQIKGEKYVDLIENNQYVITREIAKYGKIKTQVVLKKNIENDVMIFKSDIFTLNVSNSINATENLVHTVGIDFIEKIVDKNNEQDTRLDTLEANNETNKTEIENIKAEQETQNTNISDLQVDNETNKTNILNLQDDNTTNKSNIEALQEDNEQNKTDISEIKEKDILQDEEIEIIKTKNIEQDTNIQKNTDDITKIKAKDTEQDKYIAELEAENTRLREDLNGLPEGHATGESIDLSDSAEMRCDLKISGNSKQETREGYNLFNPDKALTTNTRTSGGATVTKNSDGSFAISGTGTLSSDFGGGFIDYTHEETIALLKEGKITFNCGVKTRPSCLVELIGTERYIVLSNTDNTSTSGTITAEMLANESLKMRLSFYGANGDTIVSGTIKPMLYQKGDGTFELFGKSPSLNYPSEVECCGDNGSINEVIDNGLETTDTNYKSQTYTIPVQQPFRAIGDTRDTFIKKDGKRYEHHPIVRIESYNGETITSEYMSNTGELSTGATVDYISDTPVDIECTEEQNKILDQIEKEVKTYKNITHMYSTDKISSYKDVTYKKDIDIEHNKIQKNTDDIQIIEEQIGNINTILDDINGSEV